MCVVVVVDCGFPREGKGGGPQTHTHTPTHTPKKNRQNKQGAADRYRNVHLVHLQ